ncbi:MAG: dethiobiotin synthase [Sulfuricaulis sp.]
MSGGWFITGTDTGVGKTRIAQLLLDALARAHQRAVGMKPVASGCRVTEAGLRNADAEALLAASGVAADYADVNPYALAPACAPHIAAREAGVEIRLDAILAHFHRLQQQAPWVVVEGVGGWLAPLGARLNLADIACALQLPVILVVGLRLGCLNHALLTVAAIQRQTVPFAGWIANQIDPDMMRVHENIDALKERIDAPWLATFGYQSARTDTGSGLIFPLEQVMPAD